MASLRRSFKFNSQNSFIFQVLIDAKQIGRSIEQIVQSIVTPI